MNRVRCSLTLLLLFTAVSVCSQNADRHVHRVVDRGVYESLLANSFSVPSWDPNMLFRMIVLVKPSFAPEAQVLITRWQDSTATEEFATADSNIYRKLNLSSNANDRQELQRVMSNVHIIRRKVSVPPQEADRWTSLLFDASEHDLSELNRQLQQEAKEQTAQIVMDGSTYTVTYEQGSDNFTFTLYDEEINGANVTGRFAVVRLLNTIRLRH